MKGLSRASHLSKGPFEGKLTQPWPASRPVRIKSWPGLQAAQPARPNIGCSEVRLLVDSNPGMLEVQINPGDAGFLNQALDLAIALLRRAACNRDDHDDLAI